MKQPKLILALAAAAMMTACSTNYTPVETFTEADDPIALTAEQEAAWDNVSKTLNAGWGTPELHYSRSTVPTTNNDTFHITAWRGERASAQLLIWTAEGINGAETTIAPFKGEAGTLPTDIAEAYFVRYTIADEQLYSFKQGGPTVIMPDMLDTLSTFDIAARTTRPVWVSLQVPADAAPGVYKSTVTVK